jgi:tRNA(Ile)-lysidine synthase
MNTNQPAHNLPEQFRQSCHQLFNPKDRLLLAVSGGVDSVVLADLVHLCKYSFGIAHCNFGLRGDESDGDASFTASLAKQYAVAYHEKRFDTEGFSATHQKSTQVAARELRYEWFHQLLAEEGYTYIVTAHHADDNIETLLMNFFKGSGINGLKAMLPLQGKVARPLLFARKDHIHIFAAEKNIAFREDASNATDKYTRNYFRNTLIPGIEKVFPQVTDNLLNNLHRFADIHTIYTNALAQEKKRLIEASGQELRIPVLKLLKTPAYETVLYELLKEYDFSSHQSAEVVKLLNSESGKYVNSATHRVLRNRAWLIISPLTQSEHLIQVIEEHSKEVVFDQGTIQVKRSVSEGKISSDPMIAELDARMVSFPVLLRKWKPGDYFYPLGMQKKKKLAKFFIDLKMPLTEKENTWVLESGKKIIWVVGKRIDDRCKITPSTTATISFHLRPAK